MAHPGQWFEWIDTSSGIWSADGFGVQQVGTFTLKPKMEVETSNVLEPRHQGFTNHGTAHTSAQYTTFITFELIHRKSGGKATHSRRCPLEKGKKTKKKNGVKKRAARSID